MLTILLSVCFLGEKISLPFVVCLAMILFGTGMMLKIANGDEKTEKQERK